MRIRSLVVSITMTLAQVLTMAVPAMAADPIIGTWKLNVAKSKFSPAMQAITKRPPPKEYTEVYREIEGDQIEFTTHEILADGSSRSGHLIWPRQGGTVKVLQGGVEGLTYVETLIGPGDWYVTALQDGKQFGIRHKTLSKDGKTKRETITGTDSAGKPFEQIEVFDRQ
jgi:hypothetical protein